MNPCDISLYAILDPNRTRNRPLVEMAKAAAEGGITLLQYRDKQADIRGLIDNAHQIQSALKPYNIPLLINDRVDVALAVSADGVHLGQSDMPAIDARRLLGQEAIIGLTIKTVEQAKAAPVDLLDYVCIGGVYSTLSKDNPINIGLEGWHKVASHFRNTCPDLPVGAIAGIDETNLADVMNNGADGAAIISAVFMADDVIAATRNLKSILVEHSS